MITEKDAIEFIELAHKKASKVNKGLEKLENRKRVTISFEDVDFFLISALPVEGVIKTYYHYKYVSLYHKCLTKEDDNKFHTWQEAESALKKLKEKDPKVYLSTRITEEFNVSESFEEDSRFKDVSYKLKPYEPIVENA